MAEVKDIASSVEVMPPMPFHFGLAREYMSLQRELEQVKKRLAELEAKEKVIVLREITREAAKKEIRNLFSIGRTLYYSDIAKELSLELEMVVDICNELQKSGEIGIDAGVS
ncbi:hypothetical protein ES703_96891 [subsurface metagenome]